MQRGTSEGVTAMTAAYGDIDGGACSRAISIYRTVNKLCESVAAAEAAERAVGPPRDLVRDDSHLDETRFFLLDLALQVYADFSKEARPGGRRFCDLTGSDGRAALAASLFLPWACCATLEPLAEGRGRAAALFRERDQRLARRRRATRGGGDDEKPPRLEAHDSARLFKRDWQDADVALFDATKPHYSAFVDEGALVRDVLWPGVAAALAGTIVILMTHDLNPTMRRALPFPASGDAACALLDSCVVTSAQNGEALRVDVLRVVGASNDPRVGALPAEAYRTPKLMLELAKAHRQHRPLMKHLGYKPGKHDRMIDEHAERSDDSDDDAAARLRRSSSLAAGPAGSVRSHGLQLLGMMRKNISGRPSFTRHGAGA